MSRLKMCEARRMIADYHEYQGDKDVVVIRRIPHPNEQGEAYLVHLTDAHGHPIAALDLIQYGANGQYATEFDSCPVCDEDSLIAKYMEL